MAQLKKPSMDQIKKKLTPEQYNICFLKGTEPPFSGKYTNNHATGMYECAVCNSPLFSSNAKFDSGTGWPSFDDPVNSKNIDLVADNSLGMERTEVLCKNCGSHLGHVFPDGPKDKGGQRYCINSISLNFKKKE